MLRPLLVGDAAPWVAGELHGGLPRMRLDAFAGRPIVMLLLGDAGWNGSPAALDLLARNRDLFDDSQASFFGVAMNRANFDRGLIGTPHPGMRWYIDEDRKISEAYGALGLDDAGRTTYRPHWLLLDPMLRVMRGAALDRGDDVMAGLRDYLKSDQEAPGAPVLIVPRIFEPEMCRALIDRYHNDGGVDSGMMREENGRTVGRIDHRLKRRSDCPIDDDPTRDRLAARLHRFLVPQIHRAFQFTATRIERFIVARYDDQEGGGHFRPHRDNTTSGTAHRKFACTINLNAEEYDGGDLWFPEFGTRTYRAPTGGAAIFSCSLLHGVNRVTRGHRYAFLPFFYDESGREVRDANLHLLDADVPGPA